MQIFFRIFFTFLLFQNIVFAYPNLERPNNSNSPLDLGMSAESRDMLVSSDDRYIIVNDGRDLQIIDTASWTLVSDQPDTYDSTPVGYFFKNSSQLFIALSDGELKRINIATPDTNVLTTLDEDVTERFDALVMQSGSEVEFIYLLDQNDDIIYQYNIASEEIAQSFTTPDSEDILAMALVDENTLIATSAQSTLFFIDAQSMDLDASLVLSGSNSDCSHAIGDHDLTDVAIGYDGDVAFVVDNTDNTVHVVDISLQVALDAVTTQSGTNPLCIDTDDNDDITEVIAVRTNNPTNALRAYVTGSEGLSVINADPDTLEVLDQDTGTSGNQPVELSTAPNKLAASSQSDGYIYTTNTDASISVISENPFLTISAITPSSVTQAAPTFTITFQSDEVCATCAYRVRAGGDVNESGTLLLSTTFGAGAAVDTNITTASIDVTSFASGTFSEGSNLIYIFADDSDGNTGRDAITLTLDLPPPAITINSIDFGDGRAFLNINRLTESDILQYNLFAVLASDQASPTCPGAIDFTAAAINNSVAQASGDDTQTLTVTGLVNGFYYCIGVEAQDNTGNVSATRSVFSTAVFPEAVQSLLDLAGEAGNCSLHGGKQGGWIAWLWLLWIIPVVVLRLKKTINVILSGSEGPSFRNFLIRSSSNSNPQRKVLRSSLRMTILSLCITIFLLCIMLMFPKNTHAYELTDQKYAAEVKGGFFFPTDSNMERFFGGCCNGYYELRFGYLRKSQLQLDLGLGLFWEKAAAVGSVTGRPSGERFSFMTLPISNSVTFRFDYLENQMFVPYIGAGVDYMYFRESMSGGSVDGWKFGYHVHGGLQILLEFFDRWAETMEQEGINDVYLTIEGRWTQINNFGGSGLNFSGFSTTMGLLFEF